MNRRSASAGNTAHVQHQLPERVTRLLTGNRAPGVEPRLLFPGWGPKLWEVATPESEPRERRSGGE